MVQHHSKAISHLVTVNGINLHYIDHGGSGPVLVLLHGLTANGNAFDGLVANGLGHGYRVICPDLRGNGLSEKPPFNYSVEDHVGDILGLISHLGQEQVHLGGHSFGGYLGFYMAAYYPEAINKLVILDAAKAMNRNAVAMLSDAVSRLTTTYPSFDSYLEQVKQATYLTFWDPAMLSYYRADMQDLPGGRVKCHSNVMDITEKSMALGTIDWSDTIQQIQHATLLVNAVDDYNLGEPLLPDEIARETVEMMHNAHYTPVDGNHQTMLYGDGGKQIVAKVIKFLG